jgi:GT2 family glycosyltransferase
MSKVDIVIPCYNYGRFLEACVRSVIEQSVTDIRVLIIDDASTDDTLAIATKLASNDSRISVISHPQNWGHIRTYNQGIAWASGDYFLLLSADDLLVPGALKRATMIMDNNPDIVLTHGGCITWNDALPFPHFIDPQSNEWKRQDLLKEMCSTGDIVVYDATAIVRNSVQKMVGGYLDSLPHCADLEMWLRFAAHGAVAYITATQAIYRTHASAMSRSYSFTVFGCQQRRQAFDTFFESFTDYRPDFRALRAQARKKVAKLTFRDGIDHLRRGRVSIGLQLLCLAIDQDPQLRFFPPLWWLFRFPGPQGRRWVASAVKKASIKLVRGAC